MKRDRFSDKPSVCHQLQLPMLFLKRHFYRHKQLSLVIPNKMLNEKTLSCGFSSMLLIIN